MHIVTSISDVEAKSMNDDLPHVGHPVVIGVLDSGIRWSENDLIEKHYLNARELRACPPPGADLAATDPFRGFGSRLVKKVGNPCGEAWSR
jgi:hypothetical protein